MSSTPASILTRIREVQKLLDGIAADVAELEDQPTAVRITVTPRWVPPEIDRVQRIVAEWYGVPVEVLRGPGRGNDNRSWARMIGMALAYELRGHMGKRLFSTPAVAESFGRKDHGSVLYARQRVLGAIGYDPRAAALPQLRQKLGITNGATKA